MTNQTRAKDLGLKNTNPGSYATRGRAEAPVELAAPKERGFKTILEARHHMAKLLKVPIGGDVLVDGKLMQRQAPLGEERFGHPDSKMLFKFGYGIGRYNSEVSVGTLKHGTYDIQVPEPEDLENIPE